MTKPQKQPSPAPAAPLFKNQEESPLPDVEILAAQQIATMLKQASKMLEEARTSTDFLQAVSENATIWKTVLGNTERYGWPVPLLAPGSLADRLFAGKHGLSDQDVNAIIAVNRRLSLCLLTTYKLQSM
jgi:hypothetical protein